MWQRNEIITATWWKESEEGEKKRNESKWKYSNGANSSMRAWKVSAWKWLILVRSTSSILMTVISEIFALVQKRRFTSKCSVLALLIHFNFIKVQWLWNEVNFMTCARFVYAFCESVYFQKKTMSFFITQSWPNEWTIYPFHNGLLSGNLKCV